MQNVTYDGFYIELMAQIEHWEKLVQKYHDEKHLYETYDFDDEQVILPYEVRELKALIGFGRKMEKTIKLIDDVYQDHLSMSQ